LSATKERPWLISNTENNMALAQSTLENQNTTVGAVFNITDGT